MKKLITSIALSLSCILMYAQAPDLFNYQAVARSLEGQVLSEESISVQVSILEKEVDGEPVMIESHNVTTSKLGLFNIHIGGGNPELGSIADINFGNYSYFIQIAVDENGGQNYSILGTSQLVSVPYALHAKNGYWQKNDNNYFLNADRVGIVENKDQLFAPFTIAGYDSSIPYRGQIMFIDEQHSSDDDKATAFITAYGNDLDRNGINAKGRLWSLGSKSFKNKDFLITNELKEGNISFGVNKNNDAMLLKPDGQLEVTSNDVYISNVNSGVIMKSPNGQCWRMTVSDDGSPQFASITCPE